MIGKIINFRFDKEEEVRNGIVVNKKIIKVSVGFEGVSYTVKADKQIRNVMGWQNISSKREKLVTNFLKNKIGQEYFFQRKDNLPDELLNELLKQK